MSQSKLLQAIDESKIGRDKQYWNAMFNAHGAECGDALIKLCEKQFASRLGFEFTLPVDHELPFWVQLAFASIKTRGYCITHKRSSKRQSWLIVRLSSNSIVTEAPTE